MPDVVLAFSFVLAGASGQAVQVADILQPQVAQAIVAKMAALIGVPALNLRIANVTDVATGITTIVGSGRRLGGAPGTQGVSVTLVANLGKTPTQSAVVGMISALASSNATAALSSVASTLATSKGLPPTAFAGKPGPAPVVANAPFVLPSPAALAAAAGAGAGGGSGAAIGGGVAGGIVALLVAFWMAHSKSKYGALPCCRDYERERREKLAREQALREADEMRKELQALNPIGAAAGGASGALVIRNLQQSQQQSNRKLAEKDEELARFKAQVAAQVQQSAAAQGAQLQATARAPAKRSDFEPRLAV